MQHTLLIKLLFSYFILCLLFSCNNNTKPDPFGTSVFTPISKDNIGHTTRTFIEHPQEETLVSFTIIYNGDLIEMTTNDNSSFKTLLETYNLKIEKQFKLDEENKGLNLVPIIPLASPINVGKEISLINEVLMVQVHNAKKEEKDPS